MIFSWEIRGIFIDPRKLNPMQTNSRPKKFRENVRLLFSLLNFNEIGCKQCNENDHLAFVFVTFQEPYMKSAKTLKSKFAKILFLETRKFKLPRRWCHTVLLTNYFIWKRSYQNNRLAKQEHTATVSYLILACVSNNHPVVLGSEILSDMKSIKRYITNFGYKLT